MTPFICSIAGLLRTPVPRSTCTAELSFGRRPNWSKLCHFQFQCCPNLFGKVWILIIRIVCPDHEGCNDLKEPETSRVISIHFGISEAFGSFMIFCTWKHFHCHSPVSKLCCSFQTGRSKTRKEHLSEEIRNRKDGWLRMALIGAGFLRAAQMWLANFERYKQQTWRETWQLIHAKSKSAPMQLF